MAEISYISRTSTSITVQLTGLNSGYSYDDRYVYWFRKTEPGEPSWYSAATKATSSTDADSGLSDAPLAAKAPTSNKFTFTNLAPSQRYYIWCLVEGSVGMAQAKFGPLERWTDDPLPDAEFELTQYSLFQPIPGDTKLNVSFNVTNGIGATYNIYLHSINYIPKITGTISTNSNLVTIESGFEEHLPVILEITMPDGRRTTIVEYIDVVYSDLAIYKAISEGSTAYIHIKATGIIKQIDTDGYNSSVLFCKDSKRTDYYEIGDYVTQYTENGKKIYVFCVAEMYDIGQLENIYVFFNGTYGVTLVGNATIVVPPTMSCISNALYDLFTVQTGPNTITITFDKIGYYYNGAENCIFCLNLIDSNKNIIETKYIKYLETMTFENLKAGSYKFQISAYVLYNGTEYWGVTISGITYSETNVFYSTYYKNFVITDVKNWNWNWTEEELYALDNRGDTRALTCERMNEFATCVDSMLQYKCDTERYNQYKEYINKFVFSETDNKLTAEKFNAIKFCIGSFNSTKDRIPEIVYPYEIVYGDYFKALSEKLNAIK